MELKCTLVERKSKKTGNTYVAIEIVFPNGYKKVVLPEYAESFMIQQLISR